MLYLISGLGADERIFGRLSLLESREHKHLQWIPPNGNTLKEYALRLCEQIDRHKEIILIGVSFGGMIAVEMSKILSCKQVILISSAATKQKIPLLYRFLGKLNLHKLLPNQLLKSANPVTYFLFGMYETSDKALLKSILRDTDAQFLKWAINAILQWENEEVPSNLLQIHGTKDWILPCSKSNNIIEVQNGGHLMVWTHSKQMDEALKSLI